MSNPTWGYRPCGRARVFELEDGASLPAGWHASPSVILDPARATAEALTARWEAEQRLPLAPEAAHEDPSRPDRAGAAGDEPAGGRPKRRRRG